MMVLFVVLIRLPWFVALICLVGPALVLMASAFCATVRSSTVRWLGGLRVLVRLLAVLIFRPFGTLR